MKQITFSVPVSAVSGTYVPGTNYTVDDAIAADMIKAKHAKEVKPANAPKPQPKQQPQADAPKAEESTPATA